MNSQKEQKKAARLAGLACYLAGKVEKILKGSLDLISELWAGKV